MPPSYDFSLIRKPNHSKAKRQFNDSMMIALEYQTAGFNSDTEQFFI
ncbi:hypothetical protein X969_10645 [Pseudomonas monteilii SB3078]|nr:hypothetical protein X969_10645 [Pseudomonas monteilii SB3078]